MHLSASRVFVDDLAAARQFYQDTLGLKIKWEYDEAAIGFDVGGDLIIELVGNEADAEDRALVGRLVGCSLAVDDIEALHSTLQARGVHFTAPTERQSWGGVLAHFEDPSGNLLTFVQM